MKLLLSSLLMLVTFTVPLAAECPEGHISCEKASRLNGAASFMGAMTGIATFIINCEEITMS